MEKGSYLQIKRDRRDYVTYLQFLEKQRLKNTTYCLKCAKKAEPNTLPFPFLNSIKTNAEDHGFPPVGIYLMYSYTLRTSLSTQFF